MLYFLVTARNRAPIDRYRARWGRPCRGRVLPLPYGAFLRWRRFPPGTYVFADVELLTEVQRDDAARVWDRLSQDASRYALLNHPRRSMRRVELLKALRRAGINRFDVHRVAEGLDGIRYPAFVRNEGDHRGSRTPILDDRGQLEAALAEMERRGKSRAAMLAVEFCDTSDKQGLIRKYSAFCVGGTVIPRHLFFSRNWMLKKADLTEPAQLEEEWDYVTTNPHASAIAEIFRLARIDYGRIDYALRDGQIQVWEINTNPVILVNRMLNDAERLRVHQRFAVDFTRALLAQDRLHAPQHARACPWHRLAAWFHVLRENTRKSASPA